MVRPRIEVAKLHTLTGHADCVYTLVGSGEPWEVFSSGGDGVVARWDLRQPEQGRVLAKVTHSVYALCYRPEANQLVVGQNFDGLHWIDLGEKLSAGSLQLTQSAIFDLAASAQHLWVAAGDGVVMVVDEAAKVVKKHLKASDKSARSLSYHPGRNEMAVGYSDHQVRIFDASTFELKQTLEGHTNSVFSVQYSPDGQWLLTGGRDAHLKVWEPHQAYAPVQSIVAHMYALNHIAFRPDGRYFATGSMDKSVKVWDAETFTLLKVIDKARHAGHGTSVNKLFWSSFEEQLVSGSDDRTVSVWDVKFDAE